MEEISKENLKNYKKKFIEVLGENFILQAENYSHQMFEKPFYKSLYPEHPFFYYWYQYNLDILYTSRHNILYYSKPVRYLFNILDNLEKIKSLENSNRIIKKILIKSDFYSAVFEAEIAAMYMSNYSVQIIDDSNNKGKSPDLYLIDNDNNKIYVECKALQNIKLELIKVLNNISEQTKTFCKKYKFLAKILIKTIIGFDKKDNNAILSKIKQLIKNKQYGSFVDRALHIEIIIEKVFNNVGIVNYQIDCNTEFDNTIKKEIKKASRQLYKNEFNILHLQLPINEGLDFEQYINCHYFNIKKILENDTSNINTLVVSDFSCNTKNYLNQEIEQIQYFIMPNINATKNINFDFRYPCTLNCTDILPDIDKDSIESNITLNIGFTPNYVWKDIPCGTIILNSVSASGFTQFRIWKSHDNFISFEFVLNGNREIYKMTSTDIIVPFIQNDLNIIIEVKNVNIYINNRKLNLTKV